MSTRVSSGEEAVQADAAKDGALGFNVTTSVTTPIAANADRVLLVLTNISDTPVFIGLGENPASEAGSESGLYLAANGGTWVNREWLGEVRVVHEGSGNKRVVGAEV